MYGKEKKHKQVLLHRTAASSECVSVYFSPTRPSTWTRYDVISSMNTFLVTVQNNPKESQHPHSWTWITNICLRAVKIELFWSSVKWVGSEFSNSSFFNETLYCFFTLQRGYSFTLLILLMSLYNESCNLWCKSYKLYNELFSTTWVFTHIQYRTISHPTDYSLEQATFAQTHQNQFEQPTTNPNNQQPRNV